MSHTPTSCLLFHEPAFQTGKSNKWLYLFQVIPCWSCVVNTSRVTKLHIKKSQDQRFPLAKWSINKHTKSKINRHCGHCCDKQHLRDLLAGLQLWLFFCMIWVLIQSPTKLSQANSLVILKMYNDFSSSDSWFTMTVFMFNQELILLNVGLCQCSSNFAHKWGTVSWSQLT